MPLLRDEIRTARKAHPCDAYYWFDRSCYGEQDVEPEDWKTIEAVRADGCQILQGMKHIYQVGVDGDGFSEFRARQDMDEICRKYDLYPED
ncbi:hypothetical protein N5J76_03120 [Pseudomonas sp. GD03855]|nr:hypothetical protein [Pseudomonas sp. GD03856]MDH2263911.1 hypothetical protein [Pseudomonas sp. GD03855]